MLTWARADGGVEVGDRLVGGHHIATESPAAGALVGGQREPVAANLLDPIEQKLLPGVDDATVDEQLAVERLQHDFGGL